MVSLSHLQSLLSISSFLQIPLNLITIASSHHKGAIVMPKKYPLEFKKQAIRRYEKGESIPALCQELHISQSTFYHWRNQYRSIQTSAHAYTPAEFDALVRRLQKAEHKLSIIQLSGYLSKVPLQDKLATLEHFYNEMSDLYSVHELCEALDVSRGTFYNHIFRRAD
ncbi:MAG: hypothetical protein DBY43_05115 [Clostridiaceae bacterium]|nr:MAG: hypothetical protein DBY43_05115 [Clostridiaceae bacterium]